MGNKKLKKDMKARNLHVNKSEYRSMKRFATALAGFIVGFVLTQLIINMVVL